MVLASSVDSAPALSGSGWSPCGWTASTLPVADQHVAGGAHHGMPVAVLTGACGAMFGMVLTDQGCLAARRHRSRRTRRTGHRRRDGQRLAVRGAGEHHCRHHADRRPRVGRPAHGRCRRAESPAGFSQRSPQLGVDFGLAGWPRERTRPGVDNLEQVGPGHYRTTEPVRPGVPGRRCCASTTARR